MDKLKAGNRRHGEHQVPTNVTVFKTPKGREAYISGRRDDIAILRYVGTDEFIEVAWRIATASSTPTQTS